jgi:hypothetical protein
MTAALPPVEIAKRLAAFAAVDRHIGLEHKVGTECQSRQPEAEGVCRPER